MLQVRSKSPKIIYYHPPPPPPGDIVNFVWTTNHNVVPVSAEDYLACITADTEPVEGPLAWTAPAEEGMVYVICGVRTHCADGNQKLAITVSNSC